VAAGRRAGVLTVEWRLDSRILLASYEGILLASGLYTRVATRPNVGHTSSKGIGEGVAAGRRAGLQISWLAGAGRIPTLSARCWSEHFRDVKLAKRNDSSAAYNRPHGILLEAGGPRSVATNTFPNWPRWQLSQNAVSRNKS
jgi:hypothetical protein